MINTLPMAGSSSNVLYPTCVAIQGDHAYVGVGSGLEVIDISIPDTPVLSGRVEADGTAHDIAVDGPVAVMAADTIVKVADVSNGAQPRFVGSVSPFGHALGVAVRGHYAYFVDGEPGFHVVDISDPASPKIVRNLDTPGSEARRVVLAGDHAYVVDRSSLGIIDISDPTAAYYAGSIAITDAYGLAVALPYVYVASGLQGLQIVDVSNPALPQIVGSLALSHAGDIAVSGSLATMVVNADEIRNIDVSDPTQPDVVGTLRPGGVSDIVASGHFCFVTLLDGLHAIDNSDPTRPMLLPTVTGLTAFDVAVIDDHHVGVTGFLEGLHIIDVADPVRPWIVSTLAGTYRDITIADSLAFLGAEGGVIIGDLSDPEDPVITGGWPQDDIVIGVATYGDLLFVSQFFGESCFRIFDVSDPALIHPIGMLPLTVPGNFAVRGNLVYHAAGDGFRVIDISNPAEPILLSHDRRGGTDVVVDSTFAYMAAGPGITVIDISDPGSPHFLGSYPTHPSTTRLVLQTPLIYAAVREFGVDVIDISDRERPVLVSSVDLPVHAAFEIAVNPPHAYVTAGNAFQVLDISDPKAPVLVGQIMTEVMLASFTATAVEGAVLIAWSTSFERHHLGFRLWRRTGDEEYRLLTPGLMEPPGPYEFMDREVLPGFAYEYLLEAVDRGGGIQRFGPIRVRAIAPVPALPGLLVECWPNPLLAKNLPAAIHVSVPERGWTVLDLFDVGGRRVRRLMGKNLEPGGHTVQWDGRDDRGVLAPSGVYFYRLGSHNLSASGTLALVR